MICQNLFSKKYKKNVINLASAKLAQKVVMVNIIGVYGRRIPVADLCSLIIHV